ncbi:hypothetical protein ACFFS2_11600 [Streptomyces aurantiacus]|uniref:Uncharacterized protein n=1 Tax=Streptomyces aurantiacus TaxID=47760 RepID=A0A7G1P2W5_9ACTN|nr:hypothetical protein [Streptomyces aurantiacus]BCL28167.1 hypothetical protein GCM10017557_30260 [Streptomyces aurantiacus]
MSLVELIAQADERSLAASGLACLDRCVPLLGGDDEILRPLWASLAESGAGSEPGSGSAEGSPDWGECVEQARAKLYVPGTPGADASAEGEAVTLAHRMLGAAPAERTAENLREWADACSVAALQIHRLLDATAGAGSEGSASVTARREGRTQDMSPLVAAELRRQVAILELLSAHGPAGLRQARELSTEGRRVLRAVVSRRARGRA